MQVVIDQTYSLTISENFQKILGDKGFFLQNLIYL